MAYVVSLRLHQAYKPFAMKFTSNFKYALFVLTIVAVFTNAFARNASSKRLSEYVNPFIGASTNTSLARAEHGLGKTFPGAATPWGMTQLSPNTITGGDNGSGYSYEHTTIEGFAMTQMSGIGWYGDLGNFLVMPTTGKLHTYRGTEDRPDSGYRSRYDKESEKASAGYYTVHLTDYDITAELTATPHGGVMRFTFPENDCSRIQIDLARRVGGTSTRQRVERVDDYTIRGWMQCPPEGGGWGNGDGKADYTVYFYSRSDKPLKDYGVWQAEIPDNAKRRLWDVVTPEYAGYIENATITDRPSSAEGKHIGFYNEFPTREGEQVTLRTAISFVSPEGAEANFNAELKDGDFDSYREKAASMWDRELSKIKIEGGTDDQRTIFYTALYHTMIDPRNFSDVTGEYIGGDGQKHKSESFTKRTVFSGWDVFRSQFPLQNIINPQVVNDVVNSFITLAEENGSEVFERWEFLNAYSGCMIGNPAIAVVLDAWKKGIRGYDVEKAYRFARNTADRIGHHPGHGYSPGSISETLEYAYFDWCVGEFASVLGNAEDAEEYHSRGQAYRKIWDDEKQWFRVRNADGSWAEWPEKGRLQEWYGCIECNPYQQGWFVPHDVDGMVELMGGTEKTVADLEEFFENTPREFYWNAYYNHANEPVHHVPFLFNRLGQPWQTQYWTRVICQDAYKNSVIGLCGNEDVGQMSAWYILAAAGIHPVCPGELRYELTAPLFDRMEIKLTPGYANSDKFVISAQRDTPDACYIQSATLNGKPYNLCYLNHEDIVAGGELHFVLGSEPNRRWGTE